MVTTVREYQDSDQTLLQSMIEKLWDYLVSTDPLGRISRRPEYGPVTAAQTLKKISDHQGKIYFAELDGTPVGYGACFVTIQTEDSELKIGPRKIGQIEDLFVEEPARRSGVGTLLMRTMEDHLTARGCDSIWIQVFAHSELAHGYYEQLGYTDREIGMLKQIRPPDSAK